MSYFSIFQQHLFAPYELPEKERQELDDFLRILENSNIGQLLKKKYLTVLLEEENPIIHTED